jgi:hypothetical protein
MPEVLQKACHFREMAHFLHSLPPSNLGPGRELQVNATDSENSPVVGIAQFHAPLASAASSA